jgi:HK97 family phage major capsid protein
MNLAQLRAAFEAARTMENLRALRAGIEAELRSMNEAAGDAEFTPEQDAAFLELEDEHRSLADDGETATEIRRAERLRESRAKWKTTQVAPAKPDDTRDVRSLNRNELVSRAMKIVDSPVTEEIYEGVDPTTIGFDFDGSRAQKHIAKLMRTNSKYFNGDAFARYLIASESEEYRSAFGKILARGSGNAMLTPEESRMVELVQELRAAMNITTDNQGGYGVPVLIDPSIILTGQGHPNDFFALAEVKNITTDEWKGVTSAGATSYWTTEGTTFTDGSPTLAQPTVTTKKLTTTVKYSFEIQGDYPGFAGEVAGVMAASHNEKIVEGLTQGSGTAAQPTGIVTALEANATISKVMVATDGSLFAADIYAVRDALPIRYRGNAAWMSATTTNSQVRQFGTSDPNFTVDLTAEGAYNVMGRRWYLNDYMDSPVGSGGSTSASDITPVIFGDWRNFVIANRVGATVETVQHVLDTTTGMPTGQRMTFMWARIGSNVVNPNGFRYLHQSA